MLVQSRPPGTLGWMDGSPQNHLPDLKIPAHK